MKIGSLPTIKVKHKEYKIEMIINECDFDEKLHEKIGAKKNKATGDKQPEVQNEPEVEDELKKLMGE